VAGFVGTGGRIESERVAGLRRNPHFSVDNRFMVGEFIGVDGQHHRGTFGVF
jgi:hypothetical protein